MYIDEIVIHSNKYGISHKYIIMVHHINMVYFRSSNIKYCRIQILPRTSLDENDRNLPIKIFHS